MATFHYKACTIDATPVFSLGIYHARARISREPSDGAPEGEIVWFRDLAQFLDEEKAIEFAHKWGVDWINENWA
jgi:hypothetical protein